MMKQSLHIFFIAILCLILADPLLGAKELSPEIQEKLLNANVQSGTAGRRFVVGFPGNDMVGWYQTLDIFVTASEPTTVCLKNDLLGVNTCKQVAPLGITTFSTRDNSMSWAWETFFSEQVEDKAFELTGTKPFSVYVLNSKQNTSEGYLAIPVASWGKKYIHCSFYDFNEVRPWASGFMVLASEDNTTVRIRLHGGSISERGSGKTKLLGKTIGDQLTFRLNKGQCVQILGDGQTRGTFDMSGTEIIANHPIGVISSHERCMIPSSVVTNGRDNLLAFVPPVQAWGKRYATVELDRTKDKGDYFRVVAAENNTKVRIRWWDIGRSTLIGDRAVELNAGDVFEWNNTGAGIEVGPNSPHESIRGTSLFEADKPIMVMQYSYSANWDGGSCQYDPFMFPVAAIEQYTKLTAFQTPKNNAQGGGNVSEFNNNLLNLIAIGDPDDNVKRFEMLNTVTLDGVKISTIDAAFVNNRIPETNLYWARMAVEQGPHVLKGATPFGGYIYGFATCDSYGWPAATNYAVLAETDTLEPLLSWKRICGIYDVNVIDDPDYVSEPKRKGAETDDPRQYDQGLTEEPIILENENFLPPFPIDEMGEKREDWTGAPIEYQMDWRFQVEDPYKDAFILYAFRDASILLNTAVDSLRYEADSLIIDPDKIVIPDTRVNTSSAPYIAKVESASDSVITIKSITLQKNTVFKIVSATGQIKLNERGEFVNVEIVYTPTQEYTQLVDRKDLDSLIIETECLRWAWPIEGRGIEPRIWVADFNAGQTGPNQPVCTGNVFGANQRGLEIRNEGTMALTITGIASIKEGAVEKLANPTADINEINAAAFPFNLTNPITRRNGQPLGFPFEVQPGETVYMTDLCYSPTEVGRTVLNVLFEHNALPANTKDVSLWQGEALRSDVKISSLSWEAKRRLSVNRNNSDLFDAWADERTKKLGYIYVINEGSTPANIKSISLESDGNAANDVHFLIEQGGRPFAPVTAPNLLRNVGAANVLLTPLAGNTGITMIEIPIVFNPKQELQNIQDFVVVEYLNSANETVTIRGALSGSAYEPKIELEPAIFADRTLVDERSQEKAYITISNPSTTRDLTVFGINWKDNSHLSNRPDNAQQFYDITWPANLVVPMEGSVELEVNFQPRAFGRLTADISVISDQGPAEEGAVEDAVPQRTNETYAQGDGYNTGVSITDTDFGNLMTCDRPTQTITFTNNSDTDPVTITGYQWLGNPNNVFEVVAGIQQGVNLVVNPLQSIDIDIVFYADRLGENALTAQLVVENDLQNVTSTIEGEGRKTLVNFALQAPVPPQTPGFRLPDAVDGRQVNGDFGINIDCADWQSAQITDLVVTIRYKATWLIVSDLLPTYKGAGYALPNDWDLTQEEINLGNGFKELRIEARSTANPPTPITQNGRLVNPNFLLLLPEVLTFSPEISTVALGNNRGVCVNTTQNSVPISVVTCLSENRLVEAGITPYSISEIFPNPVKASSIPIDYSIGLDGDTKIELVNSTGDIINVPVNEFKTRGEYSTQVNTSNLANGLYMLRITSGPFSQTQELIIAR